jgi:F420-dependent oxidoreductase-like protein
LNKIKFGVFLPFYAFKFEETNPSSHFDRVRTIVLECEQLGYDSIWLDDHLMFGKKPILECWTTIAALSSITTKIRLGTMVTCNSFRNPALLAKMAATLDVISNGRLELGIGAGVQKDEHIAYGVPFSQPQDRIGKMKEAVEIIKKLWTEEKASYQGKYYRINEAVCEPKPLQKPHPPITIGGTGEKLALKVTTQHADRFDWGHIPSLELYKHKLDVLKSHCKAVGRNFEEIEKSTWLGSQILSTPDECRQKIRQYTNLGVTYFMLFFEDLPNLSGTRLFAETIIKGKSND